MKKLILIITMVFSLCAVPQIVHAQTSSNTCGTTKTQIVACTGTTGVGTIGSLIKIAVNTLTVLIGVVATGGIAYGGLLYATSRDNEEKVNEAKKIIRNVVVGLFLYGFTIAIINWLIPGGVIG